METFTSTSPNKGNFPPLSTGDMRQNQNSKKSEDVFCHLIITAFSKKKPIAMHLKQLRTELESRNQDAH